MNGTSTAQVKEAELFDKRNLDWYIDKAVQGLVFVGGISAIIFIIGIFIFISAEGFSFIAGRFDFVEFFTSPWWESRIVDGEMAL